MSYKMLSEAQQASLCGWMPNPAAAAKYQAKSNIRCAAEIAPHLAPKGIDTGLWLPLMQVMPDWRRVSQGIGDCVSHGAELAATSLMAIQHIKGTSTWITEAATEPIYGGARVEANDGRLGGWSDGSWGSAAAEWLEKWGVLLRIDYSQQTGNPEHDLRKYSSSKAKSWGNYGCGGSKEDPRGEGSLDKIARGFPIKQVTAVKTTAEAAAFIENGYAITIASNVGFGSMARDNDGVVRRRGNWNHQMCLIGVRYRNGKPQYRIANSWGDSASGPDPGITHDAISACSWWAIEEDIRAIIDQDDTWAFGDVAGFPEQKLDFLSAARTWA